MKKIIYIIVLIIVIIILSILLFKFKDPNNYQKRIYNDNNLISQEGDSYFSLGLFKNNSKIELNSFTGSYTIWKHNSDATFNLDVNFENKIKSGKLKIVLIKDNEFYYNLNSTIYNLNPGNYRIKIVGLYTTSTIEYKIKVS